MTQMAIRILGAGLLVVGVLGFVMPNLLGMHLSTWHNVIHLASGAIALWAGFTSFTAARTFGAVFGVVYGALGLLGFIAPDTVASLLAAHEVGFGGSMVADSLVHVVIGAVALGAASMPAPAVPGWGASADGSRRRTASPHAGRSSM